MSGILDLEVDKPFKTYIIVSLCEKGFAVYERNFVVLITNISERTIKIFNTMPYNNFSFDENVVDPLTALYYAGNAWISCLIAQV